MDVRLADACKAVCLCVAGRGTEHLAELLHLQAAATEVLPTLLATSTPAELLAPAAVAAAVAVQTPTTATQCMRSMA
jgi:hypothetical protein